MTITKNMKNRCIVFGGAILILLIVTGGIRLIIKVPIRPEIPLGTLDPKRLDTLSADEWEETVEKVLEKYEQEVPIFKKYKTYKMYAIMSVGTAIAIAGKMLLIYPYSITFILGGFLSLIWGYFSRYSSMDPHQITTAKTNRLRLEGLKSGDETSILIPK